MLTHQELLEVRQEGESKGGELLALQAHVAATAATAASAAATAAGAAALRDLEIDALKGNARQLNLEIEKLNLEIEELNGNALELSAALLQVC
jgi:predicted  nucleic acid-binding Zn-ribbon protein